MSKFRIVLIILLSPILFIIAFYTVIYYYPFMHLPTVNIADGVLSVTTTGEFVFSPGLFARTIPIQIFLFELTCLC